MNKLHKNIYTAMFVVRGVTIGLIGNMTSYPSAFASGAKLGLADLITITAIFTMHKRGSFFLICLRLILTTLPGDTLSTSLYSTSSALLNYFGILPIEQLGPERVSIVGISVVGGFLHNVSQPLTTSFFTYSWIPMLYLLFLFLSGLLSGVTIRTAASYPLQHVQTLRKFQLNYEQVMKRKWSQFF